MNSKESCVYPHNRELLVLKDATKFERTRESCSLRSQALKMSMSTLEDRGIEVRFFAKDLRLSRASMLYNNKGHVILRIDGIDVTSWQNHYVSKDFQELYINRNLYGYFVS